MANTTSIHSDIVDVARTVEEANELINFIEELHGSTFQTHQDSFNTALGRIKDTRTGYFLDKILSEHGFNKLNPKDLDELLLSLKDGIKKLRTISMTLAFMPTEKMIDELFDWVREHLGKGIMLDLHYDPNILGGMRISYYGVYKDYTLRTALEEVFQTKKAEILSLINKN